MILPLLVSSALAIEGMWEPSQLSSLSAELRKAGYLDEPGRLADLGSAPLGAVVSLGGCTASFVSDSGLLITNHHCATGMLQRAQRAGEDLVESGFLAPTAAEERSTGASTRVYVTQGMEDVTARVLAGIDAQTPDLERQGIAEKNVKAIVAACEKPANTRCRVASFYEGLRYTLVRTLELRDIRMVMAPPDSVGNFGDDVDNWHWPRHSGDFAFIRAYVGRDGKPADYSTANVPYSPRQRLAISSRGVAPGEFVSVAGFPGRTERWLTALEVKREEQLLPGRLEHAGWTLSMLERWIANEPGSAPFLTVPRQSLSNGVFNGRGTLVGFERTGVVAGAERRDAELDRWIAADPARAAKWGPAIAELRARITARDATRARDEVMGWLGRSDLLSTARSLYRWSTERKKPDAEREPGYQERDVARAKARLADMQASLHLGSDRELVEHFLGLVLALPAEQQPAELMAWLKATTPDAGGDSQKLIAGALSRLYREPVLATAEKRAELFTAAPSAIERSTDGFLSLAVALRPYDDTRRDEGKADSGAFSRLRPAFAEALKTFDPSRAYPDANGTLRVTFGTVQGYSPRDAVSYLPQTTVRGIVEKNGPPPFAAPAPLLAAIAAGKWGPYADPALGVVPVDYLSDLDITGGNSGSPTLDARGRLVGLAFDGNYEGIASDWVFDPGLARTIHVDIRYILWYLDAVVPADHLLNEMGVQPAI